MQLHQVIVIWMLMYDLCLYTTHFEYEKDYSRVGNIRKLIFLFNKLTNAVWMLFGNVYKSYWQQKNFVFINDVINIENTFVSVDFKDKKCFSEYFNKS